MTARVALLALALSACGVSPAPQAPPAAPAVEPHPLVFHDDEVFAHAFDEPVRLRMPGARAVIVPHHWLAGDLIAGGLLAAAADGVRTVVLIGPNHTGAGTAAVATSTRPWTVPGGTVEPDIAAIASLPPDLVGERPRVLTYEHAIAGLVPAIARAFPGARLVPLAVRDGLGRPDVERLAAAVAGIEHALIVGSIDFSHGLGLDRALAMDRETHRALRRSDIGTILRWGNEHMDSPPSVATVLRAAELSGAPRFRVAATSDSTRYGASPRDVTTYVVGWSS